MNADSNFVFNRRLSVFIGGQFFSRLFSVVLRMKSALADGLTSGGSEIA